LGIFHWSFFGALNLVLGASLTIRAAEPAQSHQSFRTTILPILTKAGCNAGACHGAATGQGGFKLSLLGYDPEEDYQRITRELSGRRIDLDAPAESLFLRKPTRQLDHEGGRRIPRDSESYQTLLRWIAAGASYGPHDLYVKDIAVTPAHSLLATTNPPLKLRVTASLSDSSQADVTELALYTSNDDAIAEVNKTGEITTRGRGLTSIMVRYSGQVAAARIAVPFGETKVSDADFPANNFIDEKIRAELKRLGLPPSPLSSDAEFLRRVYLDVIGRLPASDEVRELLETVPLILPSPRVRRGESVAEDRVRGGLTPRFRGDSVPESQATEKRQRIIDDLLQREEFVDFWTMKFADLLLIGGKRGSEAGTRSYHEWLRQQIARNTPLDQIARTLLTASGNVTAVGPANFFTLATDPRDLAEHVGRIFLGTQIACARCHAHPADRWTQEDYHRFAAYFARISRDGDVIKVSTRGEVDHPKTGQPLSPKPLGASARSASVEPDRRVEMAAWLTAPDNPLFARSIVNRVWKNLFGRGLVEPVDDLRPTNPPTHPALLDAFAVDFVAHGHDLRRLIRTIVSSRTYQLTSVSRGINRLDDRFYSHAYLKELPAQVFLDAVAQVTGVPDHFDGYPHGTHAIQLVGSRTPSYALEVLGRCVRERSCESPARAGGGLAQALHLINGPTLNAKLAQGIVEHLLTRDSADREIINELYLRALTRRPEPRELAEWEPLLARASNRTEAVQDLLWTLLNSREFAFNH
jgi:hypothetical protein